MIDDFDIDFNINEDDEEVDVYETSMENLQYELYIEKQDGIDSLLDDSLHNNLKPFEKNDFDQCFKQREKNADYYGSYNIGKVIDYISRNHEKGSLANVLFFVTDKTAEAALAQLPVIEEKLKPYCVENANIFSGYNKTEEQPFIRIMFLTKQDELDYEAKVKAEAEIKTEDKAQTSPSEELGDFPVDIPF